MFAFNQRKSLTIAAVLVSFLAGLDHVGASGGALSSPIATRQVSESGSSIAWGEAEAVLAQPIEAVFPVVSDYEGYATFMPNFRRAKVLAQRGARARVYMEVSAAAGALTLWGQLDLPQRDDGPADGRVVEARLLDGNIEAFRAEWHLEPTEEGTLVGFRIYVDPDLPLPAALISRENERAARRSVEALRAHLQGALP